MVNYSELDSTDDTTIAVIDRTASPLALCRVYLEIDLDHDEPELSWGTSYASEAGSSPIKVHHGRAIRWYIRTVPTAAEANEFAEKVLPLCERIAAGYSCAWDGNNHRGSLTDDAQDADREIRDLASNPDSFVAGLSYCDADEYLQTDPGSDATIDGIVEAAIEQGVVLDAGKVEAALERFAEARPWLCWDESGCRVEIEADTAEEACTEYVNWDGDVDSTTWVKVYYKRGKDAGSVRVTIDPEEPDCSDDEPEHDWEEIHLSGHGGGVVSVDRCRHCGLKRRTDTWAQDPSDGTQGLTSVSYERGEADPSDDERADYDV